MAHASEVGCLGCPDLDKTLEPWVSLACRLAIALDLPRCEHKLLQRQVRSTTQYCDLPQCYCGMWILQVLGVDAPWQFDHYFVQ